MDNKDFFLRITNAAIHELDVSIDEKPDWRLIFQWSIEQNIAALLYETVKSVPQEFQPEPKLMKWWRTEKLATGIRQVYKRRELTRLLEEANRRGIFLLPFKGFVYADLYPNPLLRLSSDIDVYVCVEESEIVKDILQKQGFTYSQEDPHETVFSFTNDNDILVELHTCLWKERYGSRTKVLQELNLFKKDTLVRFNDNELKFLTLGYQQDLIYQIYHIVKHFSLSGMGIRHLTDLTLFIEAHYSEISFTEFWREVNKLGYTTFVYHILKICIKYFDLDQEVLEPYTKHMETADRGIIDDIIAGGTFGLADIHRVHARNIIIPYLDCTKTKPSKKSGMLIHIMFPGAEVLKNEFVYVRKHPILIPVGWIHRCFRLVAKRFGKNASHYNADTIKQAEYRLNMLSELGLIK